ncbi:hypothetical protein [Bradyrhizobium sp. NBAIM08]|uniref:hypothetical protein n=1 Tax=Bradyrhizobium sp. NBAIM08 TaxID=2793815 RepID=UPI001CD2FFDD|nr:hypothetical protein [Bradyrhizobium sp. NBAIM08]MCA1479851.1 hypothetical protein [Bradyrhizobium sp. NBAIM08]
MPKPLQGVLAKQCLAIIEEAILQLMEKYEGHFTVARAAEHHGIERRGLRRTALQLVARLQPTCANSQEGREAWVTALRDAVANLALVISPGATVARYFSMPPSAEWSRFLRPRADLDPVAWATIHEAKGSEHGAVCVVIPPGEYTEQLIAAWESRSEFEPKRVIYDGVTRAEKMLAIAVPSQVVDRVDAVMRTNQVPFDS